MEIMLIGYTESGKTYFLGSLFKLAHEVGSQGFSIEHQKFQEIGDPEKIYSVVAGHKQGVISSTMMDAESMKRSEWKPAPLVLAKNKISQLPVGVADIEGQAIRAGGNVEIAGQLIEMIPDYDGFIIVVDAPSNREKLEQSSRQLSQALNFVLEISNKNKKKKAVVSLLLNKIDLLKEASGLRAKIEEKRKEFRDNLIQKGVKIRDIPRMERSQLGQFINPLIKPVIETVDNYQLVELFFTLMGKETSNPSMVFPCSNLGFDNEKTHVNSVKQLEPYGTSAAFLWTIYAVLKSQEQKSGVLGLLKPDKIADELLKDITEIYTSGRAYFDDDDNLWSLRNIGRLYASQEWGR